MGKKVDRVNVFISPGIYDIVGIGIEDEPYKNIRLVGVEDLAKNVAAENELRPRINCHHASFSNSIVAFVDFGGSLGFQNSYFSNITARKHIHAYVSDNEELTLTEVNCEGFTFENYNGYARINLVRCKASGGVYGIQSKRANIHAFMCEFSDCKAGGAYVDTASVIFEECNFINNKGNGGAFIWSLNETPNTFKNCCFYSNTTDEKDRGAAITILGPPVFLLNCIFEGNKGSGRMEGKIVGAFRSSNGSFYVENCIFTENAGAVMTTAYSGEKRIEDTQIINTAFFKNGEDIIANNGFEVKRQFCATDRGSGIPELDSEQGLIIVNGSSVCGDDPSEKYLGFYTDSASNVIKLAEYSCLINAGTTGYLPVDCYGIQRTTMGGTDIGPVEFVGKLIPDYTLPSLKVGDDIFRYVVSEYKGKKYLFLAKIPEDLTGISLLPWGSLYVGEKTNMPDCYGDSILTYQTVDRIKKLIIYKYNGREWECVKTIPYKGNKPVIKKSVAKKNTLVITADGQNYNYEF